MSPPNRGLTLTVRRGTWFANKKDLGSYFFIFLPTTQRGLKMILSKAVSLYPQESSSWLWVAADWEVRKTTLRKAELSSSCHLVPTVSWSCLSPLCSQPHRDLTIPSHHCFSYLEAKPGGTATPSVPHCCQPANVSFILPTTCIPLVIAAGNSFPAPESPLTDLEPKSSNTHLTSSTQQGANGTHDFWYWVPSSLFNGSWVVSTSYLYCKWHCYSVVNITFTLAIFI